MGEHLRVVGVHVEYLDHDHGHWCNTCQLSTGLRVWVVVTGPAGRSHLQVRVYCYDCGGRDVTVSPDDARHC